MFVKFTRCLLAAALSMVVTAAAAEIDVTGAIDREPVDVASHPWSAIGKLFNEAGGACTGAIIARDKILTAAHCVYHERARRFLPASSLHFMVGYRGGRATVHARVASYEVGTGYDPSRWLETMEADWVILTLTENLPDEIAPLKLSQQAAPSGTKAFIAGYGRDRAHLLTADRDCEMGAGAGPGLLVFHTCRGTHGYSGAPILVSASDNEVQIAGIHVAATRRGGIPKMLAVPAQAIREKTASLEPVVSSEPVVSQDVAVACEYEPKPVTFADRFAALADSGWFE